MAEATAGDYDAAHVVCRCPTSPNNPRVRVDHAGCNLDAIAQAIAKERAWLLSECEPHRHPVVECAWRGTRAEAISEITSGTCPECGTELNEASQLRDRQKGLEG